MGGAGKEGNVAFTPGRFRNNKRVVTNNITYIANLMALQHWYAQVRSLFLSDRFPQALLDGLLDKIQMALVERINRLEAVCQKESKAGRGEATTVAAKQDRELFERWPELKASMTVQQANGGGAELRDPFLESVRRGISKFGQDYISVIQGLDPTDSAQGTRWLQGIVDDATIQAQKIIPSFF